LCYLILRSKKEEPYHLNDRALAGAVLMSTFLAVVRCGGPGSALVIMAAFVWVAPWKTKRASRAISFDPTRPLLLGGVP